MVTFDQKREDDEITNVNTCGKSIQVKGQPEERLRGESMSGLLRNSSEASVAGTRGT